jgi:DNA (cytosine-5)-methyltransferase 1
VSAIPVVDLFAGPGGLGEGFSSYGEGGRFRVRLSIEMEPTARETLRLRSFFRQFPLGGAPPEYYQYVQGRIDRSALADAHPREWACADQETWLRELGSASLDHLAVRERVDDALGAEAVGGQAVLLGGPPCQAYSMVGRSRMLRVRGAEFESDHRHVLYREYLKILADHAPALFVLENVKGLLSSTHSGERIFERILDDLHEPGTALPDFRPRVPSVSYRLFALQPRGQQQLFDNGFSSPDQFVVRTEQLGLPQARHRIIVLGVREDLSTGDGFRMQPIRSSTEPTATTGDAIDDLPALRSGLSREADSDDRWLKAIRKAATRLLRSTRSVNGELAREISSVRESIETPSAGRGGRFVPGESAEPRFRPEWFRDHRIEGVLNHEARGHMEEDLARYLFASSYGKLNGRSPRLRDFPPNLLPKHRNVATALGGTLFADRFRVQLAERPSTTITSHISKDGHYFIHPDPWQCRSLTVREAARLQTFPDNYFFEGPRTKQYVQVGNAVPPLLALEIADIVARILGNADD